MSERIKVFQTDISSKRSVEYALRDGLLVLLVLQRQYGYLHCFLRRGCPWQLTSTKQGTGSLVTGLNVPTTEAILAVQGTLRVPKYKSLMDTNMTKKLFEYSK